MPLERLLPRVVKTTRRWPAWKRHLGAAGTVAVALIVRLTVLAPLFPTGAPFQLLFLAVLVSASLFGRKSGMLAILLATLSAAWLFVPPTGLFGTSIAANLVMLGLFVAVASLMVQSVGLLQEANTRLNEANARLLEAELHMKLLLKEFRHRTGNDLMSLVGLLLMRARTAPPEAQTYLKEAAQHALGLSRVHARLAHAAGGTAHEAVVDTAEFVEGLCIDLQKGAAGNGLRPVSIHCEAESHILNTERAVQLGLVINELVTNALKYAFPEEQSGKITVNFRVEGAVEAAGNGGKQFVLLVEDSGVGLPPGAEGQNIPIGLGTRLLRSLAAQLRGEFSRATGPKGGTHAELRFPIKAPTLLPMPGA